MMTMFFHTKNIGGNMSSHFNHESDSPAGTIFSKDRSSRCKRSLLVVLDDCKYCGHHKAFVNGKINSRWESKCTRCKR